MELNRKIFINILSIFDNCHSYTNLINQKNANSTILC